MCTSTFSWPEGRINSAELTLVAVPFPSSALSDSASPSADFDPSLLVAVYSETIGQVCRPHHDESGSIRRRGPTLALATYR